MIGSERFEMFRCLMFVALLAVGSGLAIAQESSRAPEGATGETTKQLAIATRHMVVAAHPLAADAGRDILRAGGSAADAAIAVQLVLGLVEPQSSGLGGGAFVLHWDAGKGDLKTYDGRETAPASAKPDRFLKDGAPMPFDDAVRSGLSVGVPGVVRAMELLHKAHGKLPWPKLFEAAIVLAERGFDVSPRLTALLNWEGAEKFSPAARAYFFDDAKTVRATLKNPEYAAALREIAEKGAGAFYEGRIAGEIVAAAAAAQPIAGDITREDLQAYQAKVRDPVCATYRERKICGMGPPSSGTITIAQTLKLIEPFAEVRGAENAMSAAALHIIAEAEKLAYADRNKYIADPGFVSVPAGLLDEAYLSGRGKLIDPAVAMEKPAAGQPPGLGKRAFGEDATHESAGTSHFSIVDDDGNAVAMTASIESAFGSHLWASGFLLNNELTDFSFQPTGKDGAAIANAVAGGKRPRSSMAPTLVFDKTGALEVVTGSPGGSRIILYVVKSLIAMFDWGLDAQAATALLNFGSEGKALQFEAGAAALWPALQLKVYKHSIEPQIMTSGVHTIWRRNGRLEGGADPRREGVALGD